MCHSPPQLLPLAMQTCTRGLNRGVHGPSAHAHAPTMQCITPGVGMLQPLQDFSCKAPETLLLAPCMPLGWALAPTTALTGQRLWSSRQYSSNSTSTTSCGGFSGAAAPAAAPASTAAQQYSLQAVGRAPHWASWSYQQSSGSTLQLSSLPRCSCKQWAALPHLGSDSYQRSSGSTRQLCSSTSLLVVAASSDTGPHQFLAPSGEAASNSGSTSQLFSGTVRLAAAARSQLRRPTRLLARSKAAAALNSSAAKQCP